ncbi:type II toxin-antitoxin system VapC family toxin [Pelomicrobium methylotrophicum]|uniref:Type II toxin-antitoxin system VapC family toxin n=1 Tax=Pelomicrobium methylotrophicum TaxID=2602750 RepID=A0A5C7ETM0_9PROT|nr:type II toxin-antitoxin system VapC family toxin [Pelomicrobium methylotrophicum]TXF10707.1 type II toxin-antitoxin system VapC family toxin [Pelomicrobium methylotrophicum]
MILYLDTSALVKLFVPEVHSEAVRRGVRAGSVIGTHLLAYAETCSAFARLAEARKDESLYQRLRRRLDAHWAEWEIIQVEEHPVRRAADFCARYRLRGDDSIHLAAAERVYSATCGRADFRFGVFDTRLARAAAELGLTLLEA